MNDRRISLSRILAINWYGFRQILDVSGHTLVAGAFGTGKTALLDLVQYVVLGSHWRPNRAAAGNARSRSLVSYCLCDTNTRQNGEPHYTRQSGVTVIGLEFTWPQSEAERRAGSAPRRETWGMRVEFSSPGADPRCTWFGIPDRVEWTDIAPGGSFLDEDAFRTWVRRDFGRESVFSRQVDYLEEMATAQHLYFEANAFRRTLPKAIAFEPEENVERFIREFVLEESPIDVRDVRQSVSAYRETHATLANQKDEAEHLREVCTKHAELVDATEAALIFRHVVEQLHLDQQKDRLDRATKDLQQLRAETGEDRTELEKVRKQRAEEVEIIEATRLEVSRDAQAVKLDELKRHRENLRLEISRLEESRKSLRERLSALRQRWVAWLRRGDELSGRDPGVSSLGTLLQISDALIEALSGTDEAEAAKAHGELLDAFETAWRGGANLRDAVVRQTAEHQRRLQQLAQELETLDRNQELGACPVFRALDEQMPGKVRQLGRLIEVREEADRWWPTLEIYLGARRFVLVVEKADYSAAMEWIRRIPPGREPESLLNPSEAARLTPKVLAGSLATKVEVEDATAKVYVDHLLGEVLCVESVAELDQSPSGRAITPDGLYKQVPLRRRLLPEKEIPLTLGVRGRERLRITRQKEQIDVRAEFEKSQLLASDFDAWLDLGKKSGLGASLQIDPTATAEKLSSLQAEWRSTGETISLLSTPERETRLAKLKEHEEKLRTLDRREGALQQSLGQSAPREKQLVDAVESGTTKLAESEANLVRLRAALPPSVTPEKLASAHSEIAELHSDWTARSNAAIERAGAAETRATAARAARDAARHRLIDSAHVAEPEKRHPQYRTDFDALDDDNSRWAARLHQLDAIEIPKYEGLADERRRDWENRLRESVLDRLNERLDRAESEIKSLRHYLSHPVGRYRYTITQRRDPAFQNIWTLLDTGFEPTDPLMAGTGPESSREAVAELLRAVEASGGDLDERARRLLDYRHYHHYDIEMHLKDDPNAPAISLGRSMRSLSGGENQAPFFISMLAAFRRVYDLGSDRSQHVGMVVMDEAFSKLSGDGVEDCLELAANFQLQLLMAFPIDRLGVMAPFADTVIICRKEESRAANGLITRIDNIPQIISAAEALDSLD